MNLHDTDFWIIAAGSLGALSCALLGNFETYVHMTRTIRWSPAEYERWRYRTWHHLATVPAADVPVPAPVPPSRAGVRPS